MDGKLSVDTAILDFSKAFNDWLIDWLIDLQLTSGSRLKLFFPARGQKHIMNKTTLQPQKLTM